MEFTLSGDVALTKDRGLVVFKKVEDAIIAEKVLKKANYAVRLVAPPRYN